MERKLSSQSNKVKYTEERLLYDSIGADHGYVLIFVLWVIVALSLTALIFSRQIRSNIELTRLHIQGAKELYAARGAALYAFHRLSPPALPGKSTETEQSSQEEPNENFPPKLPEILKQIPILSELWEQEEDKEIEHENDSEKTLEAMSDENMPYWKPRISPYQVNINNQNCFVYIHCENGKLNLNLASSEMLDKFFQRKELSIIERQTLVESILDWLDEDDYSRLHGAESDYYKSLPAPYRCKNGFFENIEELTLVRGMTPSLFEAVRGEITVLGTSARINVNFASKDVLNSIPNMTQGLAGEIIILREQRGPLEKVEELKEIAGPAYTDIKSYITFEDGPVTSVEVTARQDGLPRVCLIASSGKIIRSYFY